MTPNLGQGGCAALEDAVLLAQQLAPCKHKQAAEWAEAVREFHRARAGRVFVLTARARAMGVALQLDNPLVCAVRDAAVPVLLDDDHFFDHTEFDCGAIPAPLLAT